MHGESYYEIAFAKFGPMNTDIFTADANGGNARPLFERPNRTITLRFRPTANGFSLHPNAMVRRIFIEPRRTVKR